MGHHHAISTDIQYKVNYAIYILQDYGYIILLEEARWWFVEK